MSESDETEKRLFKADDRYDAVVCVPPGEKPNRGYLHIAGMGANGMALKGEMKPDEGFMEAANRLDAEGWRFLAVRVQVVGTVGPGALAITVKKGDGNDGN